MGGSFDLSGLSFSSLVLFFLLSLSLSLSLTSKDYFLFLFVLRISQRSRYQHWVFWAFFAEIPMGKGRKALLLLGLVVWV